MEVYNNPIRGYAFFLQIFFLSLMALLTTTISTETYIFCLKSIKASLEDPFNYLSSSWDFSICRFAEVECWHPDENRVLNLRLSEEGLRNCTGLTGLNLSNNQIQGPIPLGINKILPFIRSLDLSSNDLSGEIPSTIANCSILNVLKLDQNRLSGQIPPELGSLTRIKQFSVANNLLSGPVPNFTEIASISAESYANNTGLCGDPLEKCEESHNSFKGGFVIAYVVFAVSTVVLYASYCVPWVHINGNRNEKITIPAMVLLMFKKKKYADFDEFASLSAVEFVLEKEILRLDEMGSTVKRLPYEDIMSATNNFSDDTVIGMGKTGTMYKATLHGHLFAVKKLHNSISFGERFISELRILGSLRHINLIRLVGFCTKSMDSLLVYKYMPNGSLYAWLHPPNNTEGEVKVMEWPIRVKVAIGLARGLAWLHQGTNIRLIHLDFCSKCVLLDHDFEPKISNFGNAMLTAGSDCINPVNGESVFEMDFMKEDVLSFGILLLELIMKIDASKLADSSYGLQDAWIKHLLSESSGYYDMIDTSVIGQGFDGEI